MEDATVIFLLVFKKQIYVCVLPFWEGMFTWEEIS